MEKIIINPKISIIVPVYNSETSIEKCLRSILNQSYENIEIIIVDDGSYDKSVNIVKRFEKLDSRVIYIYQSNKGVSAARNTGIKNSSGNYIGFVDSDDWIEKRMVETLYNNMIEFDSDLSVCGVNSSEMRSSASTKYFAKKTLFNRYNSYESLFDSSQFYGYVCNKLFKKELIEHLAINNLLFDEEIHYCEDLLFVSLYLRLTDKVVFTNEPLYCYFNKDGATSSVNYSNNIVTLITAYEKLISFYEVEHPILLIKLKRNYLKILLNIRGRVLLSKDNNIPFLDLKNKIKKYLIEILRSNEISYVTKSNIIITYLAPKKVARLKEYSKVYFK